MSLLPPDVQPALSQLLGALSSPDNGLRTQAEDQLNNDWIQNRPDVLLMGLTEQVQGAEGAVVSRPRMALEKGETISLHWFSVEILASLSSQLDLVSCLLIS